MIEHLEWNLYMYLYMVIFGISLNVLCLGKHPKNDSFL